MSLKQTIAAFAVSIFLGSFVGGLAMAAAVNWDFSKPAATNGWEVWPAGADNHGIVGGVWTLTAKKGAPWLRTPPLEVDGAITRRNGRTVAFISDSNPTAVAGRGCGPPPSRTRG